MFGSGILDLVIGLIFIYFIMSLICSSIREIFANLGDLRHQHLRDWFINIFKDKSFGDEIMNHHLIAGLTTKDKKPSYIPDNIFSTVVFDLFVNKWNNKSESSDPDESIRDKLSFTFEELKTAIENSNVLKDDLRRILVQFAGESENLSHFRTRVETWFNQAMTEAAGTYKQRSQWWILFVSLIATVALNIDSISVARFLYENPEVREQFAETAANMARDSSFQTFDLSQYPTVLDSTIQQGDSIFVNINVNLKQIAAYKDLMQQSSLPIGWSNQSFWGLTDKAWWTRFIGWLMTAIAVSMGAPFWFDMLNKLSNIRSSSKPPAEKEPEQKS